MNETEQKYARVLSGLLYALDCNLATVDKLCMVKSPSMSELRRQISIAQKTVDVFTGIGYLIERQDGRIREVVNDHNRSVRAYADDVRMKFYPDKPIK